MSHSRYRREEAASSHREPGQRHSYTDEAYGSRRRYPPPPSELLPRSTFNYWRDDFVMPPTACYPQRSSGRESRDDRWRDDSHSRRAESSYSGRRRSSGPNHDRQLWRDRSPPRGNHSRQRHATHTPPYILRPTIRARSPIESIPSLSKPVPSEPPHKASPPPDMSSQLLKPSSGYISVSQEPSETLRDPAMTRKLLVLDLNGTLLIRSARSRTTSGPQLRPVHPRPYMQSFRQYLFCLETKAWLDTMVWSSAQPHSVDDMVNKVFGTTKTELKAVWNRKSMGLSEADYHRKALTTKDLAKPWDFFASALGPANIQGHSAAPPQSRSVHSAFTTLLLDDSPHKAVLQPHSHVCIPEYDSTRRQHDLRSLLATKEPKQSKKAKRKNRVEAAVCSTDQMASDPLPQPELSEKEQYDVILLAVIGILEAVKMQSNVAGWIRQGGLWATQERVMEGGLLDVKYHSLAEITCGKGVSGAAVPSGNDTSNQSRPVATSELAHLQTKMWFNDSSVVAFWAARGREALMELGIQVVHGVTG